MNKLPYLQDNKWPTIREDEDRVVNPSHDTQLQEHLVEELFSAKSPEHQRQALIALIEHLRTQSNEM